MFEELEKAIDLDDYEQANDIIDNLKSQSSNPLWIRYYQSLMLEKKGYLKQAEIDYREIIKDSIFPDAKLMLILRNGIERIIQIQKAEKQATKDEFISQENSEEFAVLVLENVSLEQKKELAPKFAKIMELDRYTATLQIPTRSWRLYKTGKFGELNYYQSQLYNINFPSICYCLKKINSMIVYQVKSVTFKEDNVEFILNQEQKKDDTISIKISEFNSLIKANLPLFEKVVTIGQKRQIEKKDSTLDYIGFFDLHSAKNNAIFRFCDRNYQFEKDNNTTKEKWQNLEEQLINQIQPQKIYSNFTSFAEGAVQFPEMLKKIKANINLFRREETVWDEAFQLYSGLIFLQTKNQ